MVSKKRLLTYETKNIQQLPTFPHEPPRRRPNHQESTPPPLPARCKSHSPSLAAASCTPPLHTPVRSTACRVRAGRHRHTACSSSTRHVSKNMLPNCTALHCTQYCPAFRATLLVRYICSISRGLQMHSWESRQRPRSKTPPSTSQCHRMPRPGSSLNARLQRPTPPLPCFQTPAYLLPYARES